MIQRNPEIRIISARIIKDALKKFDHDMIFYRFEVDGHEVRALHWSGKYNGSKKQLARHLKRFADKLRVDYITTTESQQVGAKRAVKKRFGKKWRVQRTGEYLLITRKAAFGRMKRTTPHIKTMTFVPRWAFWRQMHRGTFNVRHHGTRRRFRITPIHGPSDIQAASRFKAGKATDVALTGWARVGKNMRRFARSNPAAVQIVPADCNANLRDPAWMGYFENATGATCIWANQVPNQGTHRGGRLIDAAWILGAAPAERKAA